MKPIHIELFPAEKTCEQGCPTCPMARKEREIIATKVDKNVQTTFSFLEKILKKKGIMYDMHFASSRDLFPVLVYPELIHMARFETNKNIRINGNIKHFSDDIRAILEKNKIDPKVIGFSIVPDYPIVSETDIEIIKNTIDEFRQWYFLKKYKTIEVTIRSNLIPLTLFETVSPQLFDADAIHIKKLVEEYGPISKFLKKTKPRAFAGGYIDMSMYTSKKSTQKIIVTNRIIAEGKTDDLHKLYFTQAYQTITEITKEIIDFAIAPKGVMLIHTSLTINNPILWMSHNDFRKSLKQALKDSKSRFSFVRFINNIIYQNIYMHRWILEHKKEEAQITHQMFMDVFERWRRKVWKLKKPRKK